MLKTPAVDIVLTSYAVINVIIHLWMFLKWVFSKVSKERREFIRLHVRNGHSRWFATCEPCATQIHLGRPLEQPELQAQQA